MEAPAGTLAPPLPVPGPERLGWVRTALITAFAAALSIAPTGAHPHGQASFAFMLGNEGIAGMAVRALQPVGLGTRDVEVVVQRRGTHAAHSLRDLYRPAGTAQIGRGATFTGFLQLTQEACRREGRHLAVDVLALDVRYETLGMTRTQRLAIDPPAQLTCR